MSLKALSDYTVYSRYAHYLPEKKRRETWSEMTKRVFDMHRRKYTEQLKNPELLALFEDAEEQMRTKRVLGSQRALQFAGPWIEKHNAKIYNCSATYIDRVEAFSEAMYLLLCGVGVGFSVQTHHVAKLPAIKKPYKGDKVFKADDSIEGWADCVKVTLAAYFDVASEYAGYNVVLDLTDIRPEGTLIAGQFKAPGPKSLSKSLSKVKSVIEARLATGESRLHAIDAYDVIMHFSDAVLSGGIRRSATLCLFSQQDTEMLNAKTGSWYIENPQRGRSNNSALLIRGEVSKEEFATLMKSTKEFGEPGFVWASDKETLFNPCCVVGGTLVGVKGDSVFITEVIERVNRGEEVNVWSMNTKTGKAELKRVLAGKLMHKKADVIRITAVNGASVVCTTDHKIHTEGDNYVEAGKLEKGDFITTNGGSSQCYEITKEKAQAVYDIEVEDNHNFYAGEVLVHNCEIGLYGYAENGATGFQTCNLSELNGKYCENEEAFLSACKAASVIGTLQAGYTDFKYLSQATQDITKREALLGVSLTGWMDNPEVLFNPEILEKGAALIKEVNEQVAKLLGINPAARTTCVKPSGSASCVLQTASGIHPQHARRYIRRVQSNNQEFAANHYASVNPIAVEISEWSVNKTDLSLSFACEVPRGAIVKNDLSAVDLLSKVKLVQEHWVNAGTNLKHCVNKSIRHNVSNTITVRDNEWGDVEKFIFDNQDNFAGISLLSASGDLDYVQAPFTTVLTPEEIVKTYGAGGVLGSGLVVDGLSAFDNNLWSACSSAIGFGIKEEDQSPVQVDWIRRAKQFAARYTENDLKKTTYLLKHLAVWKQWCDLQREVKKVDWSEVVEESIELVSADTLGAQACAGGKCEI